MDKGMKMVDRKFQAGTAVYFPGGGAAEEAKATAYKAREPDRVLFGRRDPRPGQTTDRRQGFRQRHRGVFRGVFLGVL